MDTISITIAVLSLSVSMLVAGWTIYRDAIQKPKFQVSVDKKSIYQAGRDPDGPYIFIEALNMGPISNRISTVWMRKSWWERWIKRDRIFAFIYPDHSHYATTESGARIEVGDRATFVIQYNEDTFLKDAEIGVTDGYGRFHWAPKKAFTYIKDKFKADFL